MQSVTTFTPNTMDDHAIMRIAITVKIGVSGKTNQAEAMRYVTLLKNLIRDTGASLEAFNLDDVKFDLFCGSQREKRIHDSVCNKYNDGEY